MQKEASQAAQQESINQQNTMNNTSQQEIATPEDDHLSVSTSPRKCISRDDKNNLEIPANTNEIQDSQIMEPGSQSANPKENAPKKDHLVPLVRTKQVSDSDSDFEIEILPSKPKNIPSRSRLPYAIPGFNVPVDAKIGRQNSGAEISRQLRKLAEEQIKARRLKEQQERIEMEAEKRRRKEERNAERLKKQQEAEAERLKEKLEKENQVPTPSVPVPDEPKSVSMDVDLPVLTEEQEQQPEDTPNPTHKPDINLVDFNIDEEYFLISSSNMS